MSIKTKNELLADVLSEFANNNTGDITPSVLRGFLIDFVESNLSLQSQVINSTPADIDIDTDIVYLEGTADVINLPSASDFLARPLIIISSLAVGASLTADGGDVIFDGVTSSVTYVIDPSSVMSLQPSDAFDAWILSSDKRVRATAFAAEEANSSTTTINTLGVLEAINISLGLLGSSQAFSVAGNSFTYLGKRDIDIEINANFSLVTSASAPDFIVKAATNFGLGGALVLTGQCLVKSSNNETVAGSFLTRASIVNGDTIDFIITNTTGTQNVTVSDISVSVKEI